MVRRRNRGSVWQGAAKWSVRWAIPIAGGVSYALIAVGGALGQGAEPLTVALCLVAGGVWLLIIRSYGVTQRRDAEYIARYEGTHPPEEVWAEYDGERFENLPTHYSGIKDGVEVWEVMLPKVAPPDSMGAAMIPGQTALLTRFPMVTDDDQP
jgi:hypothetical protein